jgi:SNF2 family DNA or RNA helicase
MEALNLPPNASQAEIATEILFQSVLKESLDPLAFNYDEQKAQIEAIIAALNTRLDEVRMSSMPNGVVGQMDNGYSRKRQRDVMYMDADDDDDDDDEFEGPLPKSHRASPSAYDEAGRLFGVASPRGFNNSSLILEHARDQQKRIEIEAKQMAEDERIARDLSTNQSTSTSYNAGGSRPSFGSQGSSQSSRNTNLVQLQLGRNGQLPPANTWRSHSQGPKREQPPVYPQLPRTPQNPGPSSRGFLPPATPSSPAYTPTYATSPLHGDSPGATPWNGSTVAIAGDLAVGDTGYRQESFAQSPTTTQTLPFRSPQTNLVYGMNPAASASMPSLQIKKEKNPAAATDEYGWQYLSDGWQRNGSLYWHPKRGFYDKSGNGANTSLPTSLPVSDDESDSSLEEITAAQFRPSERSLSRPNLPRSISQATPSSSGFPNNLMNGIGSGVLPVDLEHLHQQGAEVIRRHLPWLSSNGVNNPSRPFNHPSSSSIPNGYPMGRIGPPVPPPPPPLSYMSFPRSKSYGSDAIGAAVNSLSSYTEGNDYQSNSQYNYLYSDPTRTAEEIQKLVENIRPDEDLPPEFRKGTPEEMSVVLLEHQKLGLSWLTRQEEGNNKGGILADDMGLGKTIQAISLMVSRPSEDPRRKTTLIVAPVALLSQWEAEMIEKVKPRYKLTIYKYHGSGASSRVSFSQLRGYDVVLTTYGTLGSQWKKWLKWMALKKANPEIEHLGPLNIPLIDSGSKWYRVILDEAQNIKNRNSNGAKGAFMLDSMYRLCMTGTPMMNNVTELFSLIHFCRIKPFCAWDSFHSEIGRPLAPNSANYGRNRALKKLQGLIKATMLRRTKKSKLDGKPIIQLPDRDVADEKVRFEDDEEMNFYKDLEQKAQIVIKNFMKKGILGKKYTNALVLLLRLRQACCHRDLVLFSESANTMTQLDVPVETAIEMAKQLAPDVIARIKGEEGAFQCPICLDGTENPAILLPCGHTVCSECFAQLRDANQAGMEEFNTTVKCPVCRGGVNPAKITDYSSFKKVHQPELVETQEEKSEDDDDDEVDGSETDSDTTSDVSSDTESETESLSGFIVKDDVDEDDLADKPPPKFKFKEVIVKQDREKKKKRKGKKKIDRSKSLAELKKEGMRNKKAKKTYFDRLEHDYKPSAKILRTMEILNEVFSESPHEKILIFSQFTTLLDILEIPLRRGGVTFARFDGSMNAKDRAAAVESFRRLENVKVMLVSLKAGNAGLNLNIASRVIIMDPFWNPYIEDQAIDRAHRIGQRYNVIVRRVVVPETVEDRILTLQEQKRELINSALDENAARSLARLGQRELAYLFGLADAPSSAPAARPMASLPRANGGVAGSSVANALVL